MEFEPMTSREYRELGAENYETRRSLVLGLAEAVPEDATDEQISAIDAEVSVIAAEDQRRSQLAHTRNAAREFVDQGAGAPVAATEAVEETEEITEDVADANAETDCPVADESADTVSQEDQTPDQQ